jgi:hypothetical protein
MKHIILLIAALSSFFCTLAQERKHEISIGAGLISRPYAKEILRIERSYGSSRDANSSTPAFQLNYRYAINSKFNLGGTFLFERQKHSLTSSYPPFLSYHKYVDHYYTILLNSNYSWVIKKSMQLYSGLSAGINIHDRNEVVNEFTYSADFTKMYFAYQATPIGLRLGRTFGVYAELGYGYKGILCGGFSYRF